MDEALLNTIREKLLEETFTAGDIPEYLQLFCEIGNAEEDMQEEVEGWNKTMQVVVTDQCEYYIQISDGTFTLNEGKADAADFTLTMKPDDAARILTGQKDPKLAYFTGALKIDGNINDAIRIESMIEIILDELED